MLCGVLAEEHEEAAIRRAEMGANKAAVRLLRTSDHVAVCFVAGGLS